MPPAPPDAPDVLALRPVRRAPGLPPLELEIRPPGSKSLTNRAILLASLASGRSLLRNALIEADDAKVMLRAVGQLGAGVCAAPNGDLAIDGVNGRFSAADEVRLDLHNAGTATRFLAAAAVLARCPVVIDGDTRMRQRPIGELGAAIASLGAQVEYLGTPGCPPIRVAPPPLSGEYANILDIGRTASSQFISALLLIAPWLPRGLTLRTPGDLTSASYVEMTLGLLQRLGATVRASENLRVIRVGHAEGGPGLSAFTYQLEPDASGATYFWAAAAMLPGATIRVPGLGPSSLQGDSLFPDLLARMGATVTRSEDSPEWIACRGTGTLRPILADMASMPDAAMTLASVACFAPGTTIIRGLGTLRVKESDRIAAMQTELAKIGVRVENPVSGDPGAITLSPPAGGMDCSPACAPVEFDTYNDHRMAMSLALIGLRRPNVFIRNPGCVGKTYPGFWKDLARLQGV